MAMPKGRAYFVLCLLLILGRPAFAQYSAAFPGSPYVVDGVSLGDQVAVGSDAYRRYHCGPSDKFSGFTWCHKEEAKRDGRHEVLLANSILHSEDGKAWY